MTNKTCLETATRGCRIPCLNDVFNSLLQRLSSSPRCAKDRHLQVIRLLGLRGSTKRRRGQGGLRKWVLLGCLLAKTSCSRGLTKERSRCSSRLCTKKAPASSWLSGRAAKQACRRLGCSVAKQASSGGWRSCGRAKQSTSWLRLGLVLRLGGSRTKQSASRCCCSIGVPKQTTASGVCACVRCAKQARLLSGRLPKEPRPSSRSGCVVRGLARSIASKVKGRTTCLTREYRVLGRVARRVRTKPSCICGSRCGRLSTYKKTSVRNLNNDNLNYQKKKPS